jgi:hypothetical protein
MASPKTPADLLQAVVEHFNQRADFFRLLAEPRHCKRLMLIASLGPSIIVQTETPSF